MHWETHLGILLAVQDRLQGPLLLQLCSIDSFCCFLRSLVKYLNWAPESICFFSASCNEVLNSCTFSILNTLCARFNWSFKHYPLYFFCLVFQFGSTLGFYSNLPVLTDSSANGLANITQP